MAKLAIYKYVSFLMLIATIVVAVFTFVGLFGGNYPPAGNTAKAMLVYALPILIAVDLLLLLYSFIIKVMNNCFRSRNHLKYSITYT